MASGGNVNISIYLEGDWRDVGWVTDRLNALHDAVSTAADKFDEIESAVCSPQRQGGNYDENDIDDLVDGLTSAEETASAAAIEARNALR